MKKGLSKLSFIVGVLSLVAAGITGIVSAILVVAGAVGLGSEADKPLLLMAAAATFGFVGNLLTSIGAKPVNTKKLVKQRLLKLQKLEQARRDEQTLRIVGE
jgi:hypothetical protein